MWGDSLAEGRAYEKNDSRDTTGRKCFQATYNGIRRGSQGSVAPPLFQEA